MSTEYFLILSEISGKALTANIHGISLWESNGKDNQLWFWDEDGEAIRSKKFSDHVLDLDLRVSNKELLVNTMS